MDSTQGGSLASILYKVSLIGVNKYHRSGPWLFVGDSRVRIRGRKSAREQQDGLRRMGPSLGELAYVSYCITK